MFRHSNQSYLSTQLLLSVCVAFTAMPGLSGCNNQANTGVSKGTSGSALPNQTTPSAPTLKLPSQANLSNPNLQQQVKGINGTSQSQSANLPGTNTNASKVSPSTIEIPPHLAKTTAPTSGTPGVPAQIPNAASVAPASSPVSIKIPQSAPPSIPTANIPTKNIPTAKVPSNSPPGSSVDSTDALTEEGKSIQQFNQPIDPNLRLTSPSSPKAPKALTSTFESNPNPPTGTNSASSPSNSPSSSTRSNPSGLRPLEYKYNPSTGTYSTGSTE